MRTTWLRPTWKEPLCAYTWMRTDFVRRHAVAGIHVSSLLGTFLFQFSHYGSDSGRYSGGFSDSPYGMHHRGPVSLVKTFSLLPPTKA